MDNSPLLPSTQVFPLHEGEARLAAGGLVVKFGVDPTSPNLHLGHAVALRQLRQLQDGGHTVALVIGDFTAAIGDPTGRNTTRPALSQEEIQDNALTYLDQAFLILDRQKTSIHRNMDWLGQMSAADVVRMASNSTVAQMSQRKDFSKRISEQSPISLHEFLYPLFQGQDSVHLNCDGELGGTDQTFNLMMGRNMQLREGMRGQFVLTVPLLVGLDGHKKMSKSYSNEVGLSEPPVSKFSKLMQIPDRLIASWGGMLTDVPEAAWTDRVRLENPRDVKFDLAMKLVAWIDGGEAAKSAAHAWERAIKERVASDELPVEVIHVDGKPVSLVDLLALTGLTSSKTVARQKIQEGGVRMDGEKLLDLGHSFPIGTVGLLQVGKKNFKKIQVA